MIQSYKEKRLLERITIPHLNGRIELDEGAKGIYVIDATEDGVCVSGAPIPVGDVVLLNFEHPEISDPVALYARAIWSSCDHTERKVGLSFLHTNKILFKEDLTTFSRLIEVARTSLN